MHRARPANPPLPGAGAEVFFVTLGYLVARATPAWGGKSALLASLLTLDLGIGASRLYLGVHWTSDVVAGLLVALLGVAGSERLIDLAHRRAAGSPLACGTTTTRSRR